MALTVVSYWNGIENVYIYHLCSLIGLLLVLIEWSTFCHTILLLANPPFQASCCLLCRDYIHCPFWSFLYMLQKSKLICLPSLFTIHLALCSPHFFLFVNQGSQARPIFAGIPLILFHGFMAPLKVWWEVKKRKHS